MKTINSTYILGGLLVLLAMTAACTESMPLSEDDSMAEGTPLRVLASIEDAVSTRAAMDAETYDRTTFAVHDIIRIVRTRGGASSSGNYQLTASSGTGTSLTQTWTVISGSTEFMHQSAATYSAYYPVDYSGVRPDQSTAEGFRMSNRLGTATDVIAGNGMLTFKLSHSNSKITFSFTGASDITFPADQSSLLLKGTGIRTGGSAEESVRPLRPDDTSNSWCAILLPSTGSGRTVNLSLSLSGSDSQGAFTITYTGSVTCACVANTHYIYTLTVENNKLIVRESGIEGWTDAEDDEGYTGDFNGHE